MAELATISVIIPAYNAAAFLERAVHSVWATEYPALQVVIVDDGSRDGTSAVAERLCAERPTQCLLLKHPNGANLGVSASRNLGIRESRAEWIAFLDADDFYLPNRFDAWQRLVSASPAIDAVYEVSEMRHASGDSVSSISTGNDRDNVFGICKSLHGKALLEELLQGRCWATSAITIKRALLQRTGLFDPGKRIAEDCDLWFRIAAIGRIVAGDLKQPVSVYWRHANNSYHYQLIHRVAMITAMLDGWRWARETRIADDVLSSFRNHVYVYVTRSIIAAREAGVPAVARQILLQMANDGRFGFLLRWVTLRQAASIALGRLPTRQVPPGRSA